MGPRETLTLESVGSDAETSAGLSTAVGSVAILRRRGAPFAESDGDAFVASRSPNSKVCRFELEVV